MTISEVAKHFNLSYKTLIRWEKSKKISAPLRDWKGWRFYEKESIKEIGKILSRKSKPKGEKA